MNQAYFAAGEKVDVLLGVNLSIAAATVALTGDPEAARARCCI